MSGLGLFTRVRRGGPDFSVSQLLRPRRRVRSLGCALGLCGVEVCLFHPCAFWDTPPFDASPIPPCTSLPICPAHCPLAGLLCLSQPSPSVLCKHVPNPPACPRPPLRVTRGLPQFPTSPTCHCEGVRAGVCGQLAWVQTTLLGTPCCVARGAGGILAKAEDRGAARTSQDA